MARRRFLCVLPLLIGLVVSVLACSGRGLTGPVTLNVVTAGDTNMEELQRNTFGPRFNAENRNVTLNVVGTGPGDPGSRAIYNKLKAQKDAGTEQWDIDVAVVHQSIMQEMLQDDLLLKYVPETAVARYVTSADAKNSLGTDVEGYVIPLFHSQVALAYNALTVPNPPTSFDELLDWIRAHPNRFGYNGVAGGMSGVAFVTGWMYWKTGHYDLYTRGPYSSEPEVGWPAIFAELKGLPTRLTQGNPGTLDMLSAGEIDMGPVWVDMYILWQNQGRLSSDIKLALIKPGLPGQPLYIVIPARAANKDVARQYAEFMASPEIQAEVIVGENGWYPGIDPNVVLDKVPEDAKKKLFAEISPDALNKNGLMFPLTPYLTNLLAAYDAAR